MKIPVAVCNTSYAKMRCADFTGIWVSKAPREGTLHRAVVLSTVRWAADADYELTVVEDGCADADAEVHRISTQQVFPRQAAVVSTQDVLQALGA